MSRINIAINVEKSTFHKVYLTIDSIVKNINDEVLNFYILSSYFSDEEKSMFKTKYPNYSFNFLQVEPVAENRTEIGEIQPSRLLVFNLSKLVPEDKVLYLIAGVLAKKNISGIYHHYLGNYYIAGVEDRDAKSLCKKILLNPKYLYINTDVLLMNLEQFREDNLSAKLWENYIENTNYTVADSINEVCQNKILNLPIKYNCSLQENGYVHDKVAYEEAKRDVTIVNPLKNKNLIFDYKNYIKLLAYEEEVEPNDYIESIEPSKESIETDKINVALCVSKDWLKYSLVTALSILEYAKDDESYKFYIVSDEISEKYVEKFKLLNNIREVEFEFIEINNEIFDGAINDWLGVSASYRLALPTLVQDSKILYLDSDIIARQNISELYRQDVRDYFFGACIDKCELFMRDRVSLNEDEKFINSGMLLMNLANMRKYFVPELCIEKLIKSTIYTDQDVLNDICRKGIKLLPLKYNVMPVRNQYKFYEEEFEEAIKNPVLIHYTVKPWKGVENGDTKPWWYFTRKLKETLGIDIFKL